MDKVQQLKGAIEFAKQNPDSPQAIQLRRRIESGMYNKELAIIKNPPPKERSKYEIAMGIGETDEARNERNKKILGFTGGDKLAAGLGQALAQKGTSEALEKADTRNMEIQGELIKRIKEKKAKGEDTERLEKALKDLGFELQESADNREEILNPENLTPKEVIGDAAKLALTASASSVIKGANKIPIKGIGAAKGAIKGAVTGATSGAALGAGTGAAEALKDNKGAGDIAKEALKSAAIGAGAGAVIGAGTGAITGKLEARRILKSTVDNHIKTANIEFKNMPAAEIEALGGKGKLLEKNKNDIILQLKDAGLTKQAQALESLNVNKLDNIDDYASLIKETVSPSKVSQTAFSAITPNTKDLSASQYEKLLSQGKITPKTATQPSKYILSAQEKATALKYKNMFTNDPVKNTQNILDEIAKKDDEVGVFLRKNNAIFNKGELKNNLIKKLEEFDDLLVSDEKLGKAKKSVVDNFIKSMKKNNMESLWKARKEFDRQIENAFKGSPSLSKEIKKGFRNAIQDFIAEKTPDNTYKMAMREMSQLFNLKDITNQKAISEKGMSAIMLWLKKHPTKVKVIGGVLSTIGLATAGGVGLSYLRD